jgi:PKD repeat protein
VPTLRARRTRAAILGAVVALPFTAAPAVGVSPAANPFAPSSPFNLLVPPAAPTTGQSASFDAAMSLSYAEYTPAVHISGAGDPLHTIRLSAGWGPNPLNGMRVRIDPRARANPDSDGHLTIVDPSQNVVVSLYQAAAGPRADGTWWATWGGIAPLNGSGANRTDSAGGRESGISQLAGLITPDDVRRGIARGADGDLGHALALLHDEISNRTFTAPAIQAGGRSGSTRALLMGQRVFLDPTVDVNALPFGGDALNVRFGRLVARTLQRYGAIVVTNTGSGTGFQITNPRSWTSVGQPNPWPSLIGPDRAGYYAFLARAIPHTRMRAMNPSAGPGVAPGPATPPPSNAAPAAGFAFTPTAPLAGQAVRFSDTSTDADGTVALQEWDLDDDGSFDDATGGAASWTFGAAGTYTVRLRVTDDAGGQGIATRTVTVAAASGGPAPAPPGVNLVSNPSFEAGLGGWNGFGGLLSRVAVPDAPHGAYVARAEYRSGGYFTVTSRPVSAATSQAGVVYTAGAAVRAAATAAVGRQAYLRLTERTAGGTEVRVTSSAPLTLSSGWQRLQVSAPASASGNVFDLRVSQTPSSGGEVIEVDDVRLTRP